MKRSLEMPAKAYPSKGACIICRRPMSGFPECERTKEHVVPEFLSPPSGGQIYIVEGSCRDCNNNANQGYESVAARADFLVPRLLLGLRRKKRKQLPPPLPLAAQGDQTLNDDAVFTEALAKDEYPAVWAYTVFPPARVISGEPLVANDAPPPPIKLGYLDIGLSDRSASGFTTMEPRNPMAFALTVIKMAYCHTIAELGFHALDMSEVRDLLLVQRTDIWNFFGSPVESETLAREHLHAFYFRQRGEYVTVLVHLLASFGGPAYEVVVGRGTLP